VFAAAMMVGRLTGDRVVRLLGSQTSDFSWEHLRRLWVFYRNTSPVPHFAFAGFLLIGFGASNIVPILFTAAARQTDMPASIALSAVTTLGYAGILIGPALIGLVARASSLHLAFAGLGFSMLLLATGSRSRIISRF
jgi:hypothetical protein